MCVSMRICDWKRSHLLPAARVGTRHRGSDQPGSPGDRHPLPRGAVAGTSFTRRFLQTREQLPRGRRVNAADREADGLEAGRSAQAAGGLRDLSGCPMGRGPRAGDGGAPEPSGRPAVAARVYGRRLFATADGCPLLGRTPCPCPSLAGVTAPLRKASAGPQRPAGPSTWTGLGPAARARPLGDPTRAAGRRAVPQSPRWKVSFVFPKCGRYARDRITRRHRTRRPGGGLGRGASAGRRPAAGSAYTGQFRREQPEPAACRGHCGSPPAPGRLCRALTPTGATLWALGPLPPPCLQKPGGWSLLQGHVTPSSPVPGPQGRFPR